MTRGDLRHDEIGGFDSRQPRREFRALSDVRFVLAVPEHNLELEIDRLHRERGGELHADLIVRVEWAGAPTYDGILSSGRFNLDSTTARSTRAKQLRERGKLKAGDPVDFAALLEELCIKVSEAERAGGPAIDLMTVPVPTADPTITVAGFTILPDHPQILFGDGGTSKSLFALYLAGELVLQHDYTILFVDWELDEREHRRRIAQLFGNAIPLGRIHYVRCEKPLVHEVDRIKRIRHETGANFLMADSVAFGSDGKPEEAEVAARYLRSLRQIGLGSFNIAHITKGSDQDNDQKPFGSAFWHNGARMTWYVQVSEQTGNGMTIGLFNRKANLGPKLPAIAYDVDFSDDRITLMRTRIEEVESLADRLPLWQRMRQLVRHKPLTLAALAKELGAKPDTLDRTVRRMTKTFTRVTGPDGVPPIALVTRDAA